MNIIFDVLEELMYVSKEEFRVVYKHEGKEKNIAVTPFISKENTSQVFLTITYDNSCLDDVINSNLIREIALQFRRKDYHKAEMDRNSTLLILSKHDADEAIATSAKVKIEDEPYYFKKYVFSFDEISKQHTENWIKQNKKVGSLITTIQNYIASTDNFRRYKINNKNEPIYTFLVELITKIPSFPMRIVESQDLCSVDQYLEHEIDSLKNKKKPIKINQPAIDRLVEMDISEYETEKICEIWKKISYDLREK